MKNFKDGFSDFKQGGNDFGERPKFGFASGAGRKSGGQKNSFTTSRFEKRGTDRQFSRGADRSSGEMFTATCSSCHKICEVPFRPNGEKPVYCSACFGKMRDDAGRGDDRRAVRREQTSYAKSDRQISDQSPRRDERNKDLEAIKTHLAKIELQLNRVLEFVNPPVSTRIVAPANIENASVAKVVTTKPAKKITSKKVVKPTATPKPAKKVVTKKVTKKVVKKTVKKSVKK